MIYHQYIKKRITNSSSVLVTLHVELIIPYRLSSSSIISHTSVYTHKAVTMVGGEKEPRRSTRGREDEPQQTTEPQNKRQRRSTRLLSDINFCYDLSKLESLNYCSGCVQWLSAKRRTKREDSTRPQLQCEKIWLLSETKNNIAPWLQ